MYDGGLRILQLLVLRWAHIVRYWKIDGVRVDLFEHRLHHCGRRLRLRCRERQWQPALCPVQVQCLLDAEGYQSCMHRNHMQRGTQWSCSLFQCTGSPSNSDIARAACESFYGAGQCTTGTCGYFSYWYHIYHPTCGGKTTGYEWIYSNTGYANVGEDYGCGAESVSGNQLFVRYYSSNCWTLALGDLQCPGMCTGNADPYAEEAPTLLPL